MKQLRINEKKINMMKAHLFIVSKLGWPCVWLLGGINLISCRQFLQEASQNFLNTKEGNLFHTCVYNQD